MNGPMESPHATFYRQFISPGDLCFDVGANAGDKTEVFLGLGARVVMVEPQKKCADILRNKFGQNPTCTILETALGASEGEAVMYLNDADVLSTLSTEWIERMQTSGRFQGNLWRNQISVPLTSLDRLMEQHGVPAFCKIDVEGYEWHVLQGLSHPLPALSIEFAEETIHNSVHCLHRLQQLGDYEFNFVKADNTSLELKHWVDLETICSHLGQRTEMFMWGDIYARQKR
ncbi:FkbM family methyltransferase [Brevibacillus choshinensis]|uniref:FkbM family methyltransferase n=1 Tax=Brevibacillus choshinensis TaxID=54911 RepID=UPI002E1A6EFA|nr:FkbM family methyltransferase [Brevibacillus choshinensis]MED4585422.1 FkbM family methyltransferase [Brevibacillus choshinensis]MED4753922.1 FkbM family methyltransferase [Brevibacillus choshinensis]MED4779052.1 FkbM family methyltransferase [Brevibacillus choshinensis]